MFIYKETDNNAESQNFYWNWFLVTILLNMKYSISLFKSPKKHGM